MARCPQHTFQGSGGTSIKTRIETLIEINPIPAEHHRSGGTSIKTRIETKYLVNDPA